MTAYSLECNGLSQKVDYSWMAFMTVVHNALHLCQKYLTDKYRVVIKLHSSFK